MLNDSETSEVRVLLKGVFLCPRALIKQSDQQGQRGMNRAGLTRTKHFDQSRVSEE